MNDLDALLPDKWLQSAATAFCEFARKLVCPAAIVHHADFDGVVSAAYIQAALTGQNASVELATYAVSTEEYDFSHLTAWIDRNRPTGLIILDLSIASQSDKLSTIASLIQGPIFIYDHHRLLTGTSALPANVSLWNPTTAARASSRHLATFMFAKEVARKTDLQFPDELFLLALFAEGVDHAFPSVVEALAAEFLPPGRAARDRYTRWTRSRLSTLIRAATSENEPRHGAVGLFVELAKSNLSLDQIQKSLEASCGQRADEIAREIQQAIQYWTRQIEAGLRSRLVVIPIQTGLAVAGPVASILRGKFSDRVFLTWAPWRDRIVFELRSKNGGSLDLVKSLEQAAKVVRLHNYGGHPSAAGGSLSPSDFDRFCKTMQQVVEQQDGRADD